MDDVARFLVFETFEILPLPETQIGVEGLRRNPVQHGAFHVPGAHAFLIFTGLTAGTLELESVNALLVAVVPRHIRVVAVSHQIAANLAEDAAVGVYQVRPVLIDEVLNASKPRELERVRWLLREIGASLGMRLE